MSGLTRAATQLCRRAPTFTRGLATGSRFLRSRDLSISASSSSAVTAFNTSSAPIASAMKVSKRFFAPLVEDSMPESAYQILADECLEHISEVLQSMEDDSPLLEETNYGDGVLEIDCGDKGTFVINKHYATQQIWYSSPVSGAHYFEAASRPKLWISEKLEKNVYQFLFEELSDLSPDEDFSYLLEGPDTVYGEDVYDAIRDP